MRALGEEGHQDHQVGQGEQPLVGLDASALGGAGDKAQMTALGKVVHVFDADAGKGGDFRVSEDFLARFDGNHVWPRFVPRKP